MEEDKAIDILTKEEFSKKRANQKFANNSNRVRYNNNKANKLRKELQKYNRPLFLSIKALRELMQGKNEAIYHQEFLRGKNVTLSHGTHIEIVDNKACLGLYNFLLINNGNNQIKIIRI